MITFWILVAAMTLAAVALVGPAFLRSRYGKASDRANQNVAIARERLAELEADRAAGALAEETYAQARAELENTLADDIDNGTPEQTVERGGRWAYGVILVAVPALALALYFNVGAPQLVEIAGPGARLPASGPHEGAGAAGEMPPVEDLAAMLATKLEQNPNNPDGWYLLGRTYMSVQRYEDAAKAFERLNELVGEEPPVLLALADALAMSRGARMSGRPAELALRALELEPDNVTALWLSGRAAEEQGDYLQAIRYWRRVEAQVQGDPQTLAEIQSLIAEAQRVGEIPPDKMPPTVAVGAAPAAAAPAAASPSPAAEPQTAGASITVEVALDPALASRAGPDATVFVFARAVDGPPMPLAAARHTVSELPLTVTLTDAMAMMPQARLSNFARVKVSARVSQSGTATQQPGDLTSPAVEVETAGASDVSLVINSVIE